MTSGDIYNWDEKRNTVEGESSDFESFAPGSADDLVIEKKWLQLARIDPEQFRYFFDKYHDRINAFAFWRTGNADLAADITNTVFAVAWQKLGRFRWQGYSFGAWLFQLARGEIANALRKRQRRQEVQFIPDRDDVRHEDSPDRILSRQEDGEMIRRGVGQLDEMRQEVFVLHYWVGLTADQVATVLKMPKGTVTSHLKRGRKQLLDFLSDHGDDRALALQNATKAQILEDADLRLVDQRDDGEDDLND